MEATEETAWKNNNGTNEEAVSQNLIVGTILFQ